MLRIRLTMTLLAALALAGAACGGGDADTTGDRQPEAEATVATQAGSDDASEDVSDAAAAEDDVEAAAAGAPDGAGSTGDALDDAGSSGDGPDAPPAGAEALLASATAELDGRSVRGVATLEFAPGSELSTRFESDSDGDLAATVDLPPGTDPEFPAGAEAEIRYVDGAVYVRPAVTDKTLAELGVDEAWYVPGPADDPLFQPMQSAGGVMCIFPQAMMEPFEDCDPRRDAGAFLEAAREAEIVGRDVVRGTETTRVRFLVSLMDLGREALGAEPDDGTAEQGAFDDTASDPFAEGLEQFFGFLDSDFEVEVWIDDEGLVRRLAFDLAAMFAGLAGEGADAEMPASPMALEFYDFDADISVDAPPPEAIVDEDLLVGGDGYATTEEYEPYDDDYN